jgi:hypothetical protein
MPMDAMFMDDPPDVNCTSAAGRFAVYVSSVARENF